MIVACRIVQSDSWGLPNNLSRLDEWERARGVLFFVRSWWPGPAFTHAGLVLSFRAIQPTIVGW